MSVRTRYLLVAALGLGLAHVLPGQEPARLGVDHGQAVKPGSAPATNQQVADSIAGQLRQSPPLQGCKIDIVYLNGTAEVSGVVTSRPQHDEALRIVKSVSGVKNVQDRLAMPGYMPIMQVQAAMPPMGEAAPLPRPVPPEPQGPVGPFGAGSEPVPVFQPGAGGPYALNTPRMPPYAWPTYAPYNNYSRVAYPLSYPYQAWPFIGPPYPFPKVPLGWRSVKLEWADGHWWYGKTATPHDWWHVRYW